MKVVKTSILEAISLIERQPSESDVHKLIPKNRKFNFSDTIEVCATLILDEDDEKSILDYCQTIGFKYNNPITTVNHKFVCTFDKSEFVKEETGIVWEFELEGMLPNKKVSRKFATNSEEFIKVQNFVAENLIPPIIYYPNFLFDFPNRIYLEPSNTEDKEQETYRAVLDDIMVTLNEGLTIEEHIVKRLKNKNEGSEEALESTIERISAQITNVVFFCLGSIIQFARQGDQT